MAEITADEQRLIEAMIAYQGGDHEAHAELYAVLREPLRRYLWTFVRNAAAADDLLQETFMQIHRARRTYAAGRPVRPWVYAIARHVALMHLRSARRRKEYLPDDELPDFPVLPEADRIGDARTVQRLLATLPRASQEVLILHHLLGLSFQEVGKVLGLAAGTAKVRAHRALKALRARLAEDVP